MVRKLDKPSIIPGESVAVRVGEIGTYKIACARCGKYQEMSAVRTSRLLVKYKPRFVIVVGVAGVFPNREFKKGDIIIARHVYGVSGKMGKGYFVRRPDVDWAPDPNLVDYAENFAQITPDWVKEIRLKRPDKRRKRTPRVDEGYVVSLNFTVDDPAHPLLRDILKVVPEADAVEMEGSGAGQAVRDAQIHQAVVGLMIRAISDEICPASRFRQASGSEQRRVWKPYASEVAAAFVHTFLLQLPVQAQHYVEPSTEAAISEPARALRINLNEGLSVIGGSQCLEPVVDEVLDALRKGRELAVDFNITGYSESKARLDELGKQELTESVLEERYKLREQMRAFECWDQPIDQLLREVLAVVIRNLYADERRRFLSSAHEIATSLGCCFRMFSMQAPFIVGPRVKFDVYQEDSGYSFGIHVPKDEVDELMRREDVPNISWLQAVWGLNIFDFTRDVEIEQIIPSMVYEYFRLKYGRNDPPDEKQYFDIHKWKVGIG